ncbi:(p)ppGpp synthase/HD superfamily hydrolase [Nocardia kruczakiae]|uniref:(P)ppGpp synthase/HD superfamily hydrolase n=1 Tax=Nocardia kruczakiae TaxID=261477 RepID=A0ABU1XIJ8_9NOCA|nr:HD domain-containing protein [Nocardia kruczakiae]MDR7170380.1 (p)ppGpp synthase/HD superfamily hydrolase [Nocardia kruczakiae]
MESIGAGILAAMPLHTLSDVHGEEGLRQRLLLESQRKLADPERVDAALEFVADLHRDDNYGREPYLNHLLRVAIRIVSHYEVHDTDLVLAGLLHDAVEDHADDLVTLRDERDPDADSPAAALAVLTRRFGERVSNLVAAVTNPAHDADEDRHIRYRDHVAASLDRDPWARVVKISDFTDNGVGILYADEQAVMSKLATKYRPLTAVYRELITRPDTPLAPHVKQHILEQLDTADARFDVILAAGDD